MNDRMKNIILNIANHIKKAFYLDKRQITEIQTPEYQFIKQLEVDNPILENEKIKTAFFNAIEQGEIIIPYSKEELIMKELGLSYCTHKRKEAFNILIEKGYNPMEKDFYDIEGEPYFPWDDVIDCKDLPIQDPFPNSEPFDMKIYECECFNKAFWIYFKSPVSTWGNLCGTEGYLLICPHCVRQIYFEQTAMN